MATTNIVDNLISLRGHYVSLLDDTSNSTFAREQLAHVNALLVDQLQSGTGKSSARTVAAASTPDTTAVEVSPVRAPAKTPGRRGAKAGRTTTPKVPKPKGTVGSRIKLTMADEFQGLSKIDAVGKIMEEKRNQIVHMNDIIHIMFGELDDKEMKAEQMRMKDTLIRGVRRGLWQKAKGVPLSYFLGSVPAGAAKTSATKAPREAKKAPTRRKAAAASPVAKKTRATTPKTQTKTTASRVKTLSASARKKAVPARKGGRTAKK